MFTYDIVAGGEFSSYRGISYRVGRLAKDSAGSPEAFKPVCANCYARETTSTSKRIATSVISARCYMCQGLVHTFCGHGRMVTDIDDPNGKFGTYRVACRNCRCWD